MLRPTLIAAVALAATAASLTHAQDNGPEAVSLAPVTDIEWSYAARARNDEGEPYLTFKRDGMTVTMDEDDAPETITALASVTSANAGAPVAFTLEREAGPIACSGAVTERGRAE